MDGAIEIGGCGCDSLPGAAAQGLMSIEDAVARALAQVGPGTGTETIHLADAPGRVTAEDIRAPRAMPFFDNSAMDGFALRSADLKGRCCLPVAGTIAAGDAPRRLPEGAALRIYTGAPLPEGADTVVMVELCVDKGNKVHVGTAPRPGANIRAMGSDQPAGQILVARGTRLAAHHLGLLAANGLDRVTVMRPPRVAVFSTGDELREGACDPGQIPDANRPMLIALARQAGADVTDLGILPDDPEATSAAFDGLGTRFDLIVTSGAVSMGGKDHVRDALIAAGGLLEGWRVAVKPGKPVMFGRLGDAGFTGLPGNPFAVHVGFHLFVLPQIQRLMGAAPASFAEVPARAGFDWIRKPGRAEVFPVRLTGYEAGMPMLERLGHSVSATLVPLAAADGLAIVPADTSHVHEGDVLRWHPFCSGEIRHAL